MIQPAFLQEKMLETRKKSTSSHWVNWHQFGMTHRCSRIGLKRHSEENLIWACLIFHRTSKCDDSSPFSGRNCHVGACPLWTKETFLDCKKYGSCSRSLNPVNVPFIFFSEIYGRMKNLWKYEMALAVRLGTMCRCSLGWSIVISVISIIYSESRLSHK